MRKGDEEALLAAAYLAPELVLDLHAGDIREENARIGELGLELAKIGALLNRKDLLDEGIQTANAENKVKVFSANGNLSSLQDIAAGKLTADVGISSDYFGWQWADGILRMMKGDLPIVLNTTVRVFDKSDVSGLKLTPAAYATQAWYGSNSFEKGFENAWAGK